MTGGTPSQEQIQRAREFVNSRIIEQSHASEELYDEFREAAERIAAIIVKYKSRGMALKFSGSGMMASEIDEVIRWLQMKIDKVVENHYLPEDEDETETSPEDNEDEDIDTILAHIRGEFYGATFDERKELYIMKYINVLKKMSFDEFDIDEDEIMEAIMEAEDSPMHRIELLTCNTIAMGWSLWQLQTALEDGAVGFYVINGNNPCRFCADKSGYLHKIGDEVPPYHPSCQCMAVYV